MSGPKCTCWVFRDADGGGVERVPCVVHRDATIIERALRHPAGVGGVVDDAFAQARAAGAAEERARIVAWMRSFAFDGIRQLAERIEDGEHLGSDE